MKTKVIALIGEAGAGKDYLLKQAIWRYPELHEIISCTTRPKREGEIDGENYYFMTDEEFAAARLLEATEFNSWHYGTSLDALDPSTANIGVFNPAGVRSLLAQPDLDVKVFYVSVSDKTRLIRQLNREANPDIDEMMRRYLADKKDFQNLEFNYQTLENKDVFDLIKALDHLNPSLLWAKSDN